MNTNDICKKWQFRSSGVCNITDIMFNVYFLGRDMLPLPHPTKTGCSQNMGLLSMLCCLCADYCAIVWAVLFYLCVLFV